MAFGPDKSWESEQAMRMEKAGLNEPMSPLLTEQSFRSTTVAKPWNATSAEDKIYEKIKAALHLSRKEMDVLSWFMHTGIAGVGTLALEKVFDHMTNREAAALTMALIFIYRELAEEDGMGNLDSIMDILGPILVVLAV